MLLLWDDLLTNTSGKGVFTATIAGSPHQFVIEYRTGFVCGGGTANFEVVFTESSDDDPRTIYGAVSQLGHERRPRASRRADRPHFTQFGCNHGVL